MYIHIRYRKYVGIRFPHALLATSKPSSDDGGSEDSSVTGSVVS